MDYVRLEVWVDDLIMFTILFTWGSYQNSANTNYKLSAYEPAFAGIRDRPEHSVALQRRAAQKSLKTEAKIPYQYWREGKALKVIAQWQRDPLLQKGSDLQRMGML